MSVSQDKTYIFRKYFGFDIKSMIHQLKFILEMKDIELYLYGLEFERIKENIIAWADFYEKWVINDKTIEDAFMEYIDNAHLNLKDVYDTSSDTLQLQLDAALKINNKDVVREVFQLGVVRNAFSDED